MAHQKRWAKRLFREALAAGDPELLLARRSYADPGVVDLLHDRLDEMIYADPRAALAWARLVPELVQAIPEEGQKHRSRLTRAWAVLGSAHRACAEHESAEAAYTEALALIESEEIEAATVADVQKRLSVLRMCQRRDEEALKLSASGLSTLRKLAKDDRGKDLLAEALVIRGHVLDNTGSRAEAIACWGEALRVASRSSSRSVRAHQAAVHNLVDSFARGAAFQDPSGALRLIRRAKGKLKGQERSSARHRLQWLEATVYQTLGLDRRAERSYRIAMAGFERLGLPWDSALVALDLGTLLQLSGEWAELGELAAETYERFKVLSGSTEALAALSQWLKAIRSEEVTEEVTDKAREIVAAGVFRGTCRKKRR